MEKLIRNGELAPVSKYKFAFISGLHRSGTSIFFKLLKSQNNFSGFENTGVIEDEGQHLQTIFENDEAYGGPGKFGFDEAAHLTESNSLVTNNNRRELFGQWSKYWDTDCRFLVEKSPSNILRTRFLQALFPNAVFLTIIRHPVPVSMATVKWSKTMLGSLFEHWLTCHRIYENDKQYLKKEYSFHYEEFVQHPLRIFSEIEELLQLKLDHSGFNKIKNSNNKYFNWWKWLNRFFPLNTYPKSLIHRYEAEFNEFGYSLKELSWEKQ